jgi:diguanylate cyclase (GGDEF)-like protein
MSGRVGRPTVHLLVAGAGVLICIAGLSIGLTIWWLHALAVKEASARAGMLATVLAEQTNRSVQSVDLALSNIKEELEGGKSAEPGNSNALASENVHTMISERLSHLSQAQHIVLIDKSGFTANTTTVPFPSVPIDVSDRDYFRYLKNHNDGRIFISSLVDRRSGKQLVVFNKRINSANDEFAGVVLISVNFTYFEAIYHSIDALRDQTFVLLHTDGNVIVRYSNGKTYTGEKMPALSEWYGLVAQGGGQFKGKKVFDSERRLVAVRPLKDYPLVVNVAVSESSALATWRIQAATIGIGTLIVIICSGGLLIALTRQFRRITASELALVKKSEELAQSNATVDAALNNMSQGLATFDSSARLVICNRRYLEMYGLSADVVKPGCTLRDLLESRVLAGNFGAEGIEQYVHEMVAAALAGMRTSKTIEAQDGRIIYVVNEPTADGGWVATHEDITEQKKAEERITYVAHHDSLTGLANRKLFYEQLEQALKRARRGESLAVLYLDLDHLKRINDTLGHAVGDKMLKSVASRLRSCVRDVDFVARLSGDEFAIIQTSLDDPADAASLAMRVREAIHEPFDCDGHQVIVDISIGISIAPNDASELTELLKTADIALYEAKNTGRGTYCFYEKDMNERMQSRATLERELQSALVNGEFELYYQPIVGLKDNKILSFEALLRWHHPTRGMVSPAVFIPIAEETGIIISLGEWVLRQACAEAASWPDDISVAVNISPIQLANSNLVDAVVGAIASSGLRGDRLVLEVTESVFLKNTFNNLQNLKRLHELGVGIAMDDFGTGYSSLGYLLSFPFSKIKIDRSFVAGLGEKKESRAIVRAVIDLARSLKMQVVAEGVETESQLEQLRRLGCAEIQGYLFSAPRPAAEIDWLLAPKNKRAAQPPIAGSPVLSSEMPRNTSSRRRMKG